MVDSFIASVHLSDEELRRRALRHLVDNLRSGVLLVRDMGAPSGAIAELVQELESEMPELLAAGRFLAPPHGFHAGLAKEVTAVELPDATRIEANRGGGWVKFVGDFPRSDRPDEEPSLAWSAAVLAPAVRVAHSLGARVAVHATTEDSVRAALDSGVDSIEHGCALTPAQLDEMADRGIAWTPTLAAFETLLEQVRKGQADFPRRWLEDSIEGVRSLLKARNRKPTILGGTDGAFPHGQVAREVISLVDAGLSVEVALESLTNAAWSFLTGKAPLEDGAIADLTIFDRDPRDDLSVLFKPLAVIRSGRLVAT